MCWTGLPMMDGDRLGNMHRLCEQMALVRAGLLWYNKDTD